jgi:hypothetical protein
MKTIHLYSLKIKIRNNTTFSVYRRIINEKKDEFLGSFVIYPDGSDDMPYLCNQIDDEEFCFYNLVYYIHTYPFFTFFLSVKYFFD